IYSPERMSGIDAQLFHEIDRALQAEPTGCLNSLFSAVGEYLAQAVPETVRAAAKRVAALNSPSPDGEMFRAALLSLRNALDVQKEADALEAAANELAN